MNDQIGKNNTVKSDSIFVWYLFEFQIILTALHYNCHDHGVPGTVFCAFYYLLILFCAAPTPNNRETDVDLHRVLHKDCRPKTSLNKTRIARMQQKSIPCQRVLYVYIRSKDVFILDIMNAKIEECSLL